MDSRAFAPLEITAWPLFVQWQTLLGRPVNRYDFVVWLSGHARFYVDHCTVPEMRTRVLLDLQDEIDAATRHSVEAVACTHS